MRFAFVSCQKFLWKNLVVGFRCLQQVAAFLDIVLVLRHEYALFVLGPKTEGQGTDERVQKALTFIDFLFPDVKTFLITNLVELVFLELLVAAFYYLLVMQCVRYIAKKQDVVVCR